MTDAEALFLVDKLLQKAGKPGLSDLQSAILQTAWKGNSYQILADCLGYEVDYIKQIAARLWKQLAAIVGEDVSKRNLQSVLRRYQKPTTFHSTTECKIGERRTRRFQLLRSSVLPANPRNLDSQYPLPLDWHFWHWRHRQNHPLYQTCPNRPTSV